MLTVTAVNGAYRSIRRAHSVDVAVPPLAVVVHRAQTLGVLIAIALVNRADFACRHDHSYTHPVRTVYRTECGHGRSHPSRRGRRAARRQAAVGLRLRPAPT